MKFILICLVFSSFFIENHLEIVACENSGCYEVIKLFSELLQQKINETDFILAQAENELNEISFGNDETFKAKIKEVDDKLTNLLADINTGVDGGEKSLFDLIKSVFDDISEVERLEDEVEIEQEGAIKNTEALDGNLENTQETIREIQELMNRLQNATSFEGPQALQDAFDRSEKFNVHSSELNNVLDQMKLILVDYEENLLNAKNLTSIAIEKFAEGSQQANETMDKQKRVDDVLKELQDIKLSYDELKNMKTVVNKSLAAARAVYDDSFDLLNEVTQFELIDKLDKINKKIEELDDNSDTTELALAQFAEDNSKFLDEMEKTIDTAELAEQRAFKLQEEIKELLKIINAIHDDAVKAILNKDSIIENAKNIYNSLEDFTLKVEKSRESARMAMENIQKIIDKIRESEKIVEKLENDLDVQTKAATDAKQKCTTAKEQMDEILEETAEISEKIEQLRQDFEPMPDDIDKEVIRLNNESDKLEKDEEVDDKLIEATKEKIEKTKSKAKETDSKVDEALKQLQDLSDAIAQFKGIDQKSLDDLEAKINEVEKDIKESGLDHKMKELRARRFNQQQILEQYSLELAALEYQVSVIKRNAESLEHRCFKRTRLEP